MRNFSLAFTLIFVLFAGAFASKPVQAATINLVSDLTPTHSTKHGIRSDTSTSSVDLIGMLLTVNYTSGAQENLAWERLGTYRGGLRSDAGIALSYVNFGLSLITNTRISSIGFNLAPASALFDTLGLPEGAVGNTVGTKIGGPLRITGGDLIDTDTVGVRFSNLLVVAGYAAGMDAFTNLLIDFSRVSGGGLLGGFSFGVDTDSLAVAGDLTPVPLPASLFLLLAAVAALTKLRFKMGRTPVTDIVAA
jgi:hypothetical protein